MEKEFKCPLCESPLTEERFNRIVGVWEAKKKIEEQTKKELAEAKLVKENLIKQNKQIEELKGQLKKGTTPQIEGINLEHELVKELKQKFPKDRIEHHGQGGDILHYVVCEGKEIASIVYECKRTKSHSKSH